MYFNPFTADPVKALHFAILVYPTIFLFLSKFKNGGSNQHGAVTFKQQQFRTAGIEGVNYQNQNQMKLRVIGEHKPKNFRQHNSRLEQTSCAKLLKVKAQGQMSPKSNRF